VPGFSIDSFGSAFIASFLVSFMSLLFSWFLIF
jgi:putative membrane protein